MVRTLSCQVVPCITTVGGCEWVQNYVVPAVCLLACILCTAALKTQILTLALRKWTHAPWKPSIPVTDTGKWHMYNVHSIAMMIECIYHKIFTLAFLSTAQGMKESAVKRALYSWTSRQNSRQCRKVWWQPEMESHLNVSVRNREHPQSI